MSSKYYIKRLIGLILHLCPSTERSLNMSYNTDKNKKMKRVGMLKGDIISVFFGLVAFSLFLHLRLRKGYGETNKIISFELKVKRPRIEI